MKNEKGINMKNEKFIIVPITEGCRFKNGFDFKWYSVVKITNAEIAFIREQKSGDSCIDISGVVVGFISYENAEKHSISTGKLLDFYKIHDKFYYNKLLLKDLNFIKRDIVFDYEKNKIENVVLSDTNIGDKVSKRIFYTNDISNILLEINNNIFNAIKIPDTECHRLSNIMEDIFELTKNSIGIEQTKEYILKKNGIVISNVELNSIHFKGITIYLENTYTNIMKDSSLPDFYLYSFSSDNKIPVYLIEDLYSIKF